MAVFVQQLVNEFSSQMMISHNTQINWQTIYIKYKKSVVGYVL